MTTKTQSLLVTLAYFGGVHQMFAQGTAFTYQGRLNNGGSPASGLYDFRFKLYTDPLASDQVGSSYLTNAVPTTNGLFTTAIDFGAGIFIGTTNWLEVDVRTNGGGAYTILSPLQNLTPAPCAIFAETASNLSGALPASQLSGPVASANLSGTYGNAVNLNNAANNFSGSFNGNGGGLTNLNAWELSGNSGTTPGVSFLGTKDKQPLELAVNGQRALHIEYTTNTPNIIGGWSNNFAAPGVVMATIAGGGGQSVVGMNFDTNQVWDSCGTVGGGLGNIAGSTNGDPISTRGATVSGGGLNNAGAQYSTISGGYQNTVILSNDFANISGGYFNQIQGDGYYSTIGGGYQNFVGGYISAIGGGQDNIIQNLADHSVIGGGWSNNISGSYLYNVAGVIGGGYGNAIQTNSYYSTIGGGYINQIEPGTPYSTIGGGDSNTIQTNADRSTIGGGEQNQIQTHAFYSAIGGGFDNQILSNASAATIGGGYNSQIQPGAYNSTIGGGQQNQIQTNAIYSTIGGGYGNQVANSYGTVPGGYFNMAGGLYSFAAGQQAQALHQGAFVWADSQNAAFSSTRNNQFSIRAAGGVVMNVSGSSGLNPPAVAINSSSGNGIGLVVNESSTDTSALFANNGTGDILKGFSGNGNTVFEVNNDGTVKSKGFALTSDRSTKENFKALVGEAVLAKVMSMPVTEWNYRDDPADKKHIGPMAQDFHAAFQLDGADDKHISVVDEGGVALAAIQGLNQKLNEKDMEIQTLQLQNNSLAERLYKLETVVRLITEKK